MFGYGLEWTRCLQKAEGVTGPKICPPKKLRCKKNFKRGEVRANSLCFSLKRSWKDAILRIMLLFLELIESIACLNLFLIQQPGFASSVPWTDNCAYWPVSEDNDTCRQWLELPCSKLASFSLNQLLGSWGAGIDTGHQCQKCWIAKVWSCWD